MKLYALAYVESPSRSLAFYELAFGMRRRFLADGGTYGELDTPGVVVGFVAESQARANVPRGHRPNTLAGEPAGFEFGFEVEDLEAAWAKAVQAGAQPYAEPATKPWGQRIAYVRDPDGILVELAAKA